MENRVVWLVAALMTGFMTSGSSHAQQITNLIPNGGFETGAMAPWGSYGALATFTVMNECVGAAVPEGPIEGTYCLNVKVSGAGTNRWDAAVQPAIASPPGPIFQKGKKYTLSLFLKSKTGTAQVFLAPELNQDPYTGYGTLAVTMTDKWVEYHTTTPVIPADVNPAHLTIHVAYAAQEFWIDDAKWYEGDYVPTVFGPILTASLPSPAWGDVDVPRDTALSWTPGPFANTHDVYLGGTFDDVNNAGPASLLVSHGQTAATYAPASLLDFGQTYYWRVDEINAPPDSSVYKGRVWSFTTEPYSYPVRPTKATASSSFNSTMGPEKTIDGSGLNSLDQHGTTASDMWLSKKNQSPIWIQYEFDQVYKLDQMWVWNSNQEVEPISGFGALDVAIETSTDGATWTPLPDVPGFNPGTGEPNYVYNTTVDFGGVSAKYVKLTIGMNWAFGAKQAGLSEVRFFYVPVKAFRPAPAAGATDVALDARLNWRPGRSAAKHQVYLGTDPNSTNLIKTTTAHSLDLGSLGLLYGQTYDWRVDEVNDAATPSLWQGDVWSFTTPAYAVVDDFEAYDDLCKRVFFRWQDGFGYSASPDCGVSSSAGNGTGSTVGNTSPPFAEQTITHSGGKSMPLWFDNTRSPFYSETQREWATPQAWTGGGINTLVVYLQGDAAAFVETSPGTLIMNGTGTDIWNASDQFRFVYKPLKGNGSIVAKVESVANTHEWAKAGVMIRESASPGAKHAFVAVTPTASHGISYQRRVDTDVASDQNTDIADTPVPQWVKVTRSGNTFTAQYSGNGTTWTDIVVSPAVSITMANDVLIGLAVTSHQAGSVCGAKFSNVSTTGTVSGSWQVAEIGVTQVAGNLPETFYVALQDSAGKMKVVSHPDPMVISTGSWEQWSIPLSQFTSAGVNLGSIKKMVIGVGERSAPKAGNSGKLYIDDIRLQP